MLIPAGLVVAVALAAPASPPKLVVFGLNDPAWNRVLAPAAVRMGCDLAPAECAARADKNAKLENAAAIQIAVPFRDRLAGDAEEYAKLAAQHPVLREIGIDDFTSTYYHAYKDKKVSDPLATLKAAVENARAAGLRFGVTVYESDLESPYLQDPKLPAALREEIGAVHLYLHHRENGPRYREYVQKAKSLFPKAEILAGAYPFDRIDYMPCSQGGKDDCSKQQELDLFSDALKVQAALLGEGAVSAIELYPAEFGREDKWNGWNNPRFCKPERRQACVDNTKAMRQSLLEILGLPKP